MEDTVQMRDEYAVVRHGDVLVFGAFHAVKHFARIQHTAAAMDDQTIFLQVFGECLTARRFETKLFLRVFGEPMRDFYCADVVALTVVCTAFRNKHRVAVRKARE